MAIQEIGIVIDLSRGTFNNTIYKDGRLQLAQRAVDGDGRTIYFDTGYWESEAILIQDKIAAFKNVVRTTHIAGGAAHRVYVKTSDDGFTWSEYIELASDNSVVNVPAKYAKIKIEIIPEKVDSNFYVDKFEEKSKYVNEFTNSEAGILELRKQYGFTLENSVDKPQFFRAKIPNSKFKKIDQIIITKG